MIIINNDESDYPDEKVDSIVYYQIFRFWNTECSLRFLPLIRAFANYFNYIYVCMNFQESLNNIRTSQV